VGEIAVVAEVGVTLGQFDGPPHVLGDRGAVRFNVERQVVLCRRVEDVADEAIDGRVVFYPPRDMQRRAVGPVIIRCRAYSGDAEVDAADCSTLHVAWGIEDDAAVDRLVGDIFNASTKHDLPLYVETHRATITQDMWRTVELTKRHPDLRYNGDFSHWYTGQEMCYGGFDESLRSSNP